MPAKRAERTAREIQLRRLLGAKRKRRRALPRQVFPMGVERDYTRALLRIVARVREEIQPLLDELPSLLGGAKVEQARLDAGESKRAQELLEATQVRLSATVLNTAALNALAGEFARKTSSWQRVQMLKQTRAALGVDLALVDPPAMAAAIEGFEATNVGLMKDLGRKTVADIEGVVQRGIQGGTLHADLAKEINGSLLQNRNRARLIARDQVGKFYGRVNKVRQESIGVTKFKWRTSNDERVREEHVVLEGLEFSWEGGAPGEGVPGEPVSCRCHAEPVLDELLGR